MNDSDLCALLSGGAAPNVDVVLYLLPHTGMILCASAIPISPSN
jgi:hypothetical protein